MSKETVSWSNPWISPCPPLPSPHFNSTVWKQLAMNLLHLFSWLGALRSSFKASNFILGIPFWFPCQAPWGFEAVADLVQKSRSILSTGRSLYFWGQKGDWKNRGIMQTFLPVAWPQPQDFSLNSEMLGAFWLHSSLSHPQCFPLFLVWCLCSL